jgi:hypothetical protein
MNEPEVESCGDCLRALREPFCEIFAVKGS